MRVMNKITWKWVYTYALMLLILPSALVAQQSFRLDTEALELKVEGTSTIHDWEMISSKATGSFMLNQSEDGSFAIADLQVELQAESLESGKRKMNKNAYKALNTRDYPTISYRLSSAELQSDSTLLATGELKIAGHTETVQMTVNYQMSEGAMHVHGSLPILFTQFNIDPPTAVFGTIKTGDELTLSFKSTFRSK